jgi:uncharacterized protein YjbI with pentapeptide repeats
MSASPVSPVSPSQPPPNASASIAPGQGFRALTERWTRERVERVIALLHSKDREALARYLDEEVPRVPHATDPKDMLDLKGFRLDRLGYRADLGQVSLVGLNLWSARFEDVNLKGATFERCLLGLSYFETVYLRDVNFTDCDLYGSDFERCHLRGIKLVRTSLKFCTFSGCEIDPESFAEGLYEEQQGRWALARDIYRALRLNLNASGDERGSSWAIYQESVMQRRYLRSKGRRAEWLFSLLLDVLWGYGQRPARLFSFSLVFIATCAGVYFFSGIKLGDTCTVGLATPSPASHLFECLYFSFITFTTVGYGDIVPCSVVSRMVAATEAFAGIFIMSLFVTANVRKLEGH